MGKLGKRAVDQGEHGQEEGKKRQVVGSESDSEDENIDEAEKERRMIESLEQMT